MSVERQQGRILIVDDEDDIRRLWRIRLQTKGVPNEFIDEAKDEQEAIKAVTTTAYRVVMLDYSLKGERNAGGLEVGRTIRETKINKQSYVINIGSSTRNLYADEWMRKGQIDFDYSEAAERIAGLLAHRDPIG